MKYNIPYCEHYRCAINQNMWWCDKQSANPNNEVYKNCDCLNCPEQQEMEIEVTTTSEVKRELRRL